MRLKFKLQTIKTTNAYLFTNAENGLANVHVLYVAVIDWSVSYYFTVIFINETIYFLVQLFVKK